VYFDCGLLGPRKKLLVVLPLTGVPSLASSSVSSAMLCAESVHRPRPRNDADWRALVL